MTTAPTAAILAVGSELLSGQVTNRNAAWLAAKLADHGLDTVRHLVVDDVESDIVHGLDDVAKAASVIFVTGGLGPTSDDLTRQAVAAWAGLPLAYDSGSWDHIVGIFSRVGRTVPDTNKQQCFFPSGARVLTNRAGTANAFTFTAKGHEIFVLPGPPTEVEAVWNDHVEPALRERVPPESRKRLRMWRTIGRGESHLAELLEPILKGQAVEVAYRAHAPYIELKIRYPEIAETVWAPLCDRITATLTAWLYEVDRQDVPRDLAERLASFRTVAVFDGLTEGHLAELLAPAFREAAAKGKDFAVDTTFAPPTPRRAPKSELAEWLENGTDADVALAIAGYDDAQRWAIGIRIGTERSVVDYPAPYKATATDSMRGRNAKAIAALASKAWLALLSGALH